MDMARTQNFSIHPLHKKFADFYLNHGNATEAAVKAYGIKNRSYASVKAHRLIRNAKIKRYMDGSAITAVDSIVDIALNAKSSTVRLRANQDILDRAGYKK